jgi:hypothetical protein
MPSSTRKRRLTVSRHYRLSSKAAVLTIRFRQVPLADVAQHAPSADRRKGARTGLQRDSRGSLGRRQVGSTTFSAS